jgi:hypothetical protein
MGTNKPKKIMLPLWTAASPFWRMSAGADIFSARTYVSTAETNPSATITPRRMRKFLAMGFSFFGDK